MELTPEYRALLGVDAMHSARNEGYHLNALASAINKILQITLQESGIESAAISNREDTGDGVLLTLSGKHLGRLVDLSQRINLHVSEHNRWRKPDLQLRIAIDIGPVADAPGYYASKITHNRLMNANIFKELLERCTQVRAGTRVNTGLVISECAYKSVFGGNYTELVEAGDFASLPVADKEFEQIAWVRIPGFDPNTITNLIGSLVHQTSPASLTSDGYVHNEVRGNMNGVQAGTVNGAITFTTGRS